MTPKLTIQNAEIKTASVEVKTLTISGKQVTLAVFRQLREEPLIAKDGTLNGVPWGVVNYHPEKGCGELGKHWHVVWQRGAELLRSAVVVEPNFGIFQPAEGQCFLMGCVIEHINGGSLHFNNAPLVENQTGAYPKFRSKRYIHLSDVHVELTVPPNMARAVALQAEVIEHRERAARGKSPTWFRAVEVSESDLDSVRAELDETAALFKGRTANDFYQDLKAVCQEEAARRDRHRELRKAIADLPQLFIAV